MPNKLKSSDSLVIFWLTNVVIISILYLCVMHPAEITNTEAWIAVSWIFFVVSIPAFLIMLLVHFMLFSIEQKYKRMGIRLMSWVAFLITYELWKAMDSGYDFFDPLFKETFGIAAMLLAVSHVLSFMLLSRIRKKRLQVQTDS